MSQHQPLRSFAFQFLPEILIEIFLWTTPLELLQLRDTCHFFRCLVEKQYVWRTARRNVQPPIPDPVLPDDVYNYSGSWSEAAFARYIFGATKCSFCGGRLSGQPFAVSYSLRLFSCLATKCKEKHLNDLRGITDDDNSEIQPYLPYLETTGRAGLSSRRYTRFQLKTAEEEWKVAKERSKGVTPSRATRFALDLIELHKHANIRTSWLTAYMKTAEALMIWQAGYVVKVRTTNAQQQNLRLARRFASASGADFAAIGRSVAFTRVMLAFTRSNSYITASAWSLLQTQVEDERAEMYKPRPREVLKRELKCPHCPNASLLIFREAEELEEHVRRRHSEIPTAKIRCPHCPKISVPVFHGKGDLEDHIRRRHQGAGTCHSSR